MENLESFWLGLSFAFFVWVCLCIFITGAEEADRASYEKIMAEYHHRITQAKNNEEREVAEQSKVLFMQVRSAPSKKWC